METRRRLDPEERTILWRQLASLLQGGLTLPDALLALGRDAEAAALRAMTEALREAVLQGGTLAAALRGYPRDFDRATLACIAAGERTGELPAAIAVLAAYAERTQLLRLRGRMVLAYPLILLCFTLFLSAGLIRTLTPMSRLFEGYGAHAPVSLLASLWLVKILLVVVLVLCAVALAAVVASRLPRQWRGLHLALDRLQLSLPFWGRYARALLLGRFTRTLAFLLHARVPLPEALDLASGASGSLVLEDEIRAASRQVADGERAGRALRAGIAITPATVWSLRVAEERGDLEETLGGLADYFDETAAIRASTLLTAVEPLAVCGIGILAAAVVVTAFLPIYSLYWAMP